MIRPEPGVARVVPALVIEAKRLKASLAGAFVKPDLGKNPARGFNALHRGALALVRDCRYLEARVGQVIPIPLAAARLAKIRSKIPMRDQRTNRL